jgi:hypothetical protein
VHNPADNEWATVQDAARIMGVTKQAIRQRIYRNTIPHTKDQDGTVYVRITSTNAEDHGETNDVDNTVLMDYVETLKERIRHLEDESRRKDHLLAAALERIPAIESPPDTPSEPRESPVTPQEEPVNPAPETPFTEEDPYLTHAPPTPEHPATRPEHTVYGTSRQEAEESPQTLQLVAQVLRVRVGEEIRTWDRGDPGGGTTGTSNWSSASW